MSKKKISTVNDRERLTVSQPKHPSANSILGSRHQVFCRNFQLLAHHLDLFDDRIHRFLLLRLDLFVQTIHVALHYLRSFGGTHRVQILTGLGELLAAMGTTKNAF